MENRTDRRSIWRLRRGSLPRSRVATAGVTALLVNIFQRKQEAQGAVPQARGGDRGRRRPGQVGRQLAARVRRLPAHRRAHPHQVRRRAAELRGHAAAREGGARPVAAAHVRRLPLRHRLPRPPRPRLHAAGPGGHEAQRARGGQAVRQLPPLPRLDHAALPEAGAGGAAAKATPAEQVQKGLQQVVSEMDYWDAHKLLEQTTGGKVHPVSCVDCHDPEDHGAARDPAGLHRRHPEAGRCPQRRVPHLPSIERWRRGDARDALRPERRRHPPGDALVRLRPVPRRVLLRQGPDPLLPLGQGAEGRADRAHLRQPAGDGAPLQGLDPRRDRRGACSRRSIPSSRCGARASTPAAAWPAPTATCPTSARARSRSRSTGCAARCSRSTAPARPATRTPTRSSRRGSRAIQDRHFALLTRAGEAASRHARRHRGGAEAVREPRTATRRRRRRRRRWRGSRGVQARAGGAGEDAGRRGRRGPARAVEGRAGEGRRAPRARASCSARPSGGSTSWRPRTRWGSTRRRSWRGSWASRSTCRARRRSGRSRSPAGRCRRSSRPSPFRPLARGVEGRSCRPARSPGRRRLTGSRRCFG